jgi:2-succinyl-6-hydroxy-2,4-cyclohexadiene-1-carboxylate synthase
VQEPLWDRLSELTMPVLLIAGSYDRVYSNAARKMAEAIGPSAQVVILERAGHAAHLEQPEALAHELASWATGLASA